MSGATVCFEAALADDPRLSGEVGLFVHDGRVPIITIDGASYPTYKRTLHMPRGALDEFHKAAFGAKTVHDKALVPRAYYALLLATWQWHENATHGWVSLGSLARAPGVQPTKDLDAHRSWLTHHCPMFQGGTPKAKCFRFKNELQFGTPAFCPKTRALVMSLLADSAAPAATRSIHRDQTADAGYGAEDMSRFCGEYDEWITKEGNVPNRRRRADVRVTVGIDADGLFVEGRRRPEDSFFRSTVIARDPDKGFARILFTYQNHGQGRTEANPDAEPRAHGICVMDFTEHGFTGWFKSSVNRSRFFTYGVRRRPRSRGRR